MKIQNKKIAEEDIRLSYARVIVNPVAGGGKTIKKWPGILDILKRIGMHFDYVVTEAPGHAIELAAEAANDGYKMIISVGGDGTINEVVNGIYNTGGIEEVNLGIISTGTGSDYVRTVGVPRCCEEACQHLLSTKRRVVDLGIVEYMKEGKQEKRNFVNFAGLGFDAEIVKATTLKFKALGTLSSYLMGLLTTLVSYHNKEVTCDIDGKKEKRKVCAIMTSIGRYGGGSMLVAPNADPSDGLFDVLIIGDMNKPDLLWSLPRIYKGTHLTHHKVESNKAKVIEINSPERIFIQADGELLGETPARFHILPSRLNIIV